MLEENPITLCTCALWITTSNIGFWKLCHYISANMVRLQWCIYACDNIWNWISRICIKARTEFCITLHYSALCKLKKHVIVSVWVQNTPKIRTVTTSDFWVAADLDWTAADNWRQTTSNLVGNVCLCPESVNEQNKNPLPIIYHWPILKSK